MAYNNQLVNDHRKLCTKDTNEQLYELLITGDVVAQETMIINNMPLVMSIVEGYLGIYPNFVYLRDDLVAEGFLGLTKSINVMAENKRKPDKLNPTSFMSVTIRNCIRDYFKNEIHDESIEPDLLSDRPNNKTDELIDNIHSCCTEIEHEIIDLWIGGNTVRDIASELNTTRMGVQRTINAVKTRLIAKINQ